jgi:hypothetical protein
MSTGCRSVWILTPMVKTGIILSVAVLQAERRIPRVSLPGSQLTPPTGCKGRT